MVDFRKVKIFKVVAFLSLARLVTCIPIPGLEFDSLVGGGSGGLVQDGSNVLPLLNSAQDGWVDTLGDGIGLQPFLTIGSLGLVPYLNSSTIMAVLLSTIPALSRLQNEQGESGRQEIMQYTRYLNLLLSIIASTYCSFVLLKPGIFNWSFALGCKIVFSLVMGSVSYMWILELINSEAIVNDSTSILLVVNSLASVPVGLSEMISYLSQFSFLIGFCILFCGFLVLSLSFVSLAGIVTAEKRISLVSAKQLNFNYLKKLYKQPTSIKDTYIPVRICAGGLMPVIMTLGAAPFFVLLGGLLPKYSILNGNALLPVGILGGVIFVFFNIYYGLFAVRPQSVADNLEIQGLRIPGIRPGIETKKYLQQVVTRISFMGALVLALWFFPFIFFLSSSGTSFLSAGFLSIAIFFSSFIDVMEEITFLTEYDEFFPKRPY
jgi:preprotein translocase subunit SecY